MARRDLQERADLVGPAGETNDPALPVRVLVVSGAGRQRIRLTRMLERHVESLTLAHSREEAQEALRDDVFDLAIIGRHQPDGCGIALAGEIGDANPDLVTVILSDTPSLEDAVAAMRAGASDLVDALSPTKTLGERLTEAARKARRVRQRGDRVRRLRRLCHQLNNVRLEMSGQVGDLCNDLVEAYRNLSTQLEGVGVTAELNSLMRQELDIESLLRTVLEFLLAKVGPTNAGIFLPSSTGDYSLGAYVNYDRQGESAEVLFDHLADVLAPRFEAQDVVLTIHGDEQFREHLGDDAGWLEGSTALVVACCEGDECLAVLTVFRDARRPFDDATKRLLQAAAPLFGAQLARIIRVHNRHLPEHEWGGGFEPEEDTGFDDLDLAA